jgi:hypothetical protein
LNKLLEKFCQTAKGNISSHYCPHLCFRVGKFAQVVMVSAILASPSDRVRGREEEREKEKENAPT